jgi:hypothetical protein
MGIFNYFNASKIQGTIIGKPAEYFVLSRVGKGSSHNQLQNQFKAMLQDDTQVTNGDIVTIAGETYFVVAKRTTANNSTMCHLYKCNCIVDIVRIQKHYTGSNYDYDMEVPLFTGKPSFYEDITGKMQLFEIGLLATSTRRFLLPNIALKLLDRIKFNNEKMQVDAINTSSYPGLLMVQCSLDKRVTK